MFVVRVKVRPYYNVLVNGRRYQDLPSRLDTNLKEGDVMALFLPIAGAKRL